LLLAGAVAAIAIISYLGAKTYNPVIGEDQYISITKDQEIALGIQAAPELAAQYGGLESAPEPNQVIDRIGERLVRNTVAAESGYPFDFTLLDDDSTINAFALPGGQVFITNALFQRLENEDQLAGVLGHEIGHVIARHGAQHIAKQELTQGLTGAVILATYDPDNPGSQRSAQIAILIGNLVNMKYNRDDELQSDWLGVCLMHEAGYDPSEMLTVMNILAAASQGSRPPEFFSTHPNPENRIQSIQAAIDNIENCP
jgi:predicted Zn-dependent protease